MRLGEGSFYSMKKKTVDAATVSESHLVLARMRVDIDRRRIHLQVEDVRGVTAVIENIAVPRADRMTDDLVPYQATIQKEILQIGLGPRESRQAKPAAQFKTGCRVIDTDRVVDKLPPTDLGDPPLHRIPVRRRSQIENGLLVVDEAKRHIESTQCQAPGSFFKVAELGPFRTHEFSPSRRVVEKISDFYRSAGWMRCRTGLRVATALGGQSPS